MSFIKTGSKFLILANVFCLLILFIYILKLIHYNGKTQIIDTKVEIMKSNTKSIESLLKNAKFKINNIYALVFYGRKPQASILLRYLDRNLKVNGGILDKIVFVVKTFKKQDLEYLDERIFSQNKPYYELANFPANVRYRDVYVEIKDDDLVFKIDDDIVFISNGTFEKMLEEYLTKDILFLSANVVNHPILSYVHARLRAILPFYEAKNFTWWKNENLTELDKTPAGIADYGPYSRCWWVNGKCGAIAHESFLYHAKNNNLNVYDFNLWDFHYSGYSRWSINFVLMRGEYVNKLKVLVPDVSNDEMLISYKIPEKLGKHCYALGSALVSHFSYGVQSKYLNKTNILSKYDQFSKQYLNLV